MCGGVCVNGISREVLCVSCGKSMVSAEPERQLLGGIERVMHWE